MLFCLVSHISGKRVALDNKSQRHIGRLVLEWLSRPQGGSSLYTSVNKGQSEYKADLIWQSHKPEINSYLWCLVVKFCLDGKTALGKRSFRLVSVSVFSAKCRPELVSDDTELAFSEIMRSLAHSSGERTLPQCAFWETLNFLEGLCYLQLVGIDSWLLTLWSFQSDWPDRSQHFYQWQRQLNKHIKEV